MAAAEQEIPTISPLLHPLDEFYLESGMQLPSIYSIDGIQMPEPYRSLLVHEKDMTPQLQNFHNSPISLEVLRREQRGDFYYRGVVLHAGKSELYPVEFGAIKISLLLFPPAARREILEEKLPLGSILAKHKVAHTSRPKAFLKMKSDRFINEALRLKQDQLLYGRRNTHADLQGRPLAEIIEILPPAPSAPHRSL
ncbi:MAG: hypothetical protein ACO1QB_03610 [Verrucomicrobiales bacterium]